MDTHFPTSSSPSLSVSDVLAFPHCPPTQLNPTPYFPVVTLLFCCGMYVMWERGGGGGGGGGGGRERGRGRGRGGGVEGGDTERRGFFLWWKGVLWLNGGYQGGGWNHP